MDDTLLNSDLLSASEYNGIKPFEEQEQSISQEHLRALADIYVGSKMHHRYGAGILHRHVRLLEGHIMVHTSWDRDIDICSAENVEDLDREHITPHSFFLNSNGVFQAYEYDSTPRPQPDSAFLNRVREFLLEHELAKSVAILAEDSREDSVEFLLSNEKGMICMPREEAYNEIDERGLSVVTGWKFCETSDGQVEIRERRGCDPQGDGQHKVKDAAALMCS